MKTLIRKVLDILERYRIYPLLIGAAALIWFFIRVIPKPQRAFYPCQRAAFPLASAFIIWIVGTLFSKKIFKKAQLAFARNQVLRSILFGGISVCILLVSFFFFQISDTTANTIGFMRLKKTGASLYERDKAAITESIVEAQSVVSIVRSNKAEADAISFSELNTMVRKAVSLAGGFDNLIQEGDTVVLKPNVIASKDQSGGSFQVFPETANGIATDYRIIQIVVNMVREKNTSGKIFLIEASGYATVQSEYLPSSRYIVYAPGQTDIRFILRPEAWIQGMVIRDPNGQPIIGILRPCPEP